MRDQIDQLATITVLGVLEQGKCPLYSARFAKQTLLDCYHSCVVLFLAYFALQVIYARRKYKISPPETTGHPEFERIFRAQANCSEYFPIFISLLWIAGIFFRQDVTVACGLLYLYTRLKYFQGYTVAAQGRLGPMYASALLLWLLLGLAIAGLLAHFLQPHSST
ncbi:leukotriene C4 synthase-like [Chiroxiphia lanceolata]|uniref:leukotriene C4 synthase-like n=1 Tax=Chiroxiphia lanceolata TaxID=296741 RepID=UPI0013CE6EB9|nr:leukotriene C4 synthase-like [Chiroxiphia lanceolata]